MSTMVESAGTTRVIDEAKMQAFVEKAVGENVEENLNPVGRVYSGASVLCCSPNAFASGNVVLGTIAPEADFRKVAQASGFGRFRRAAATPFNRVFELRA